MQIEQLLWKHANGGLTADEMADLHSQVLARQGPYIKVHGYDCPDCGNDLAVIDGRRAVCKNDTGGCGKSFDHASLYAEVGS